MQTHLDVDPAGESDMLATIRNKLKELEKLCRKYHVRRLAIFGSAVRDDFAPEHSDLDFLVEFSPLEPGARAEAYFGLLFDLEDLLGHDIDLIEVGAVRNPYVRRTIDLQQETLYAVA
jgi:predicted nucleotidyltransferase